MADQGIGSDPAQVEVVRTASNQFEAQMQTIDAFGTHAWVDLRIQVSPQPEEHEIWRALDAGSASIREP